MRREYHFKQINSICIWKDSLHRPQLHASPSLIPRFWIWSNCLCSSSQFVFLVSQVKYLYYSLMLKFQLQSLTLRYYYHFIRLSKFCFFSLVVSGSKCAVQADIFKTCHIQLLNCLYGLRLQGFSLSNVKIRELLNCAT